MVKKLFLSLTCGFFTISFTNAGEIPPVPQQLIAIFSTIFPGDTLTKDSANIKKSIAVITKDPKTEFHDLLASSAFEDDVYNIELNPKAVSFVENYEDIMGGKLDRMKEWGRPYFDMMDEIFIQHGLPVELKYLAVVESELKSTARSGVGAVGPWQFMPATARDLGLKVTKYKDERRDFYKSTHAAARYLTQLYGIYNDWLLVIAAYNCGPGGVNSAIRRSGTRDFWHLQNYLPAESRKHVKKFIATHYIMEGEAGLTTLTKKERKELDFSSGIVTPEENLIAKIQEIPNTKKLTISGKYSSLVITKQVSLDIREFNKMNPNFDNMIAMNGNYDLRLPNDKMDLFLANKYQILNESLQLILNAANNTATTLPVKKTFDSKL
jgi:membrane-bound lytic murein transglycosylase D